MRPLAPPRRPPPASADRRAFAASRRGALARAAARKRSAGAAMFIVAITLGLLAAMGVYGLSATAVDVRAAGHLRESAQAQSAAEHAMVLTANTFTPGTSGEIVKAMMSGRKTNLDGTITDIQMTKCKTSNHFNGTWNGVTETNAEYRAAQACLSWNVAEMERMALYTNQWKPLDSTTQSTFAVDSFGDVPNKAFVHVEVTNPVDVPPPPGMALNGRFTFTQVTVTTFVDMKNATPATEKDTAAEAIAVGRGRMTVGPYSRL